MTGTRYRGGAALVTGASSGIGEAFARALGARGADVLLTGLPQESEQLERIAAEIATRHGVRTAAVPVDLSLMDGPQTLVDAVDRLEFTPTVLVNSAGFGLGGAFAETSLERQLDMIRVNALALVAVSGAFLPRMIARQEGVVVNIASTAALQPMPYFAVYAASKSFVLAFGEAVWAEARTAGVRVVTVCSGPVSTPFHERAGDTGESAGVKRRVQQRYLTPETVVAVALAAVEADKPRVVLRLPGGRALFAATAAATALLPRRLELLAIERFNRWLFAAG